MKTRLKVPAERYSGHESFVCRYGWLKKAYDHLSDNPMLFSDADKAVAPLGIGKNMVHSLRSWVQWFGVAQEKKGGGLEPTMFAHELLNSKHGRDPYLEDPSSLWHLHWKLTTTANLAAWNLFFRETHDWRIPRKRAFELLSKRAQSQKGRLVDSTLKQHLSIFVDTYAPDESLDFRTLEESLGSPLQEMGLLSRRRADGAEETIEFRIGPKPGISAGVFLSAVVDYWLQRQPESRMLSLQSICYGDLSPGIVFKLDESTVALLLSQIQKATKGALQFQEDAVVQGLRLADDQELRRLKVKFRLL